MPTPDPKRDEGRALFLNAMQPLRVAQTEGFRQGLIAAAEVANKHPDASGRTVARLLLDRIAKLPTPPVAE